MRMTLTIQQTSQKNNEVSKIIDKVLKQIFGVEATLLIYRYLEKTYSLKQDEITQKIDLFAKGLEEFLNSGAYMVERKILDDIYKSYGLLRKIELDRMQEFDFVSQVKVFTHRA
jgi:hypothetical protein